jgi:hypothetical protein
MTSENGVVENSLYDSLARINQYLGRLQQLPDKSTLKNTLEDDLWKVATKQSNPQSEVKYSELPKVAHSIFGRFEEEGEQLDPWWLREFNWKAEFGGEELTLRNDELKSFAENFDRDRTIIKKPRLVA